MNNFQGFLCVLNNPNFKTISCEKVEKQPLKYTWTELKKTNSQFST